MIDKAEQLKALVIYHSNCTDGSAAAWCAHQALTKIDFEVVMHPATHGDPTPLALAAECYITYILDFSYSREAMVELSKVTKLTVLDHHASAEKACEGLDFCSFDMRRSGAGMAWDYFNPNVARPWFIDYVEDRDIWKWEYGNSREALIFIDTMPKSLETWYKLFDGIPSLGDAVAGGTSIIAYVEQYNKEIIESGVRYINFMAPDGMVYKNIPVVNVNYKNTSDVVHKIAESHPFGLGWFRLANGKYKYSIRVTGESNFDASVLATTFGGGGHVKAAGFVLSSEIVEVSLTENAAADIENIEAEIAELDRMIAESPSWGAAVSAMSEERRELARSLARLKRNG